MAQNKSWTSGPTALSATLTTNILNPPTLTGGVGVAETKTYILVKQIRLTNKTGVAHNATLYKGLTGANTAGTEVCVALNVPANSYIDVPTSSGWYFKTADFLVGGADANTSLVITLIGEIGIAD